MKAMKQYLLFALALPALWGCADDPQQPTVPLAGEPSAIAYAVARAAGENAPAPPEEGTAYTFVSYRYTAGNAEDPASYGPNYEYQTNQSLGYYTYLHDQDIWKGIMQPCSVEAPNTRWKVQEREVAPDPGSATVNGQALLSGAYMSVCMHPAVDLFNNGSGSFRMLFTRTDERYVSDPFRINVQGYEVFPLPEPYNDGKSTLPIRDIRSKVWFEIIQGSNRQIRILEPQLLNAGYWGWYHPLLRNTQISYEAGTQYETTTEFHDDDLTAPGDDSAATTPKTGRYSIYDKDDPHYQNATSVEVLDEQPGAAPTNGTGHPDTIYGPVEFTQPADGKGQVIYTTGRGAEQGIFFFANDYRSTDKYLQPGINFKLQMGEGTDTGEFRINIPFDIDMKPNHAYLFRLTVESSVIRVHFRTMPWEGTHDNGGDIGNNNDWITLGLWTVTGWEDHDMNNGDNQIGR